MVCAIEDSGFEIRDQLAWIYGSGFPKSQNVGKMIDKNVGAKRKVVGQKLHSRKGVVSAEQRSVIGAGAFGEARIGDVTEPSTELAKKYDGWGTALKPAQEPIVLARKPISEKTVAANVIKHTTGAINIDASRVATDDKFGGGAKGSSGFAAGYTDEGWVSGSDKGRWPANIIHDGSAEVLELFPENVKGGTWAKTKGMRAFNNDGKDTEAIITATDKSVGSAARFFYCAKANKQDRNDGCEELDAKSITNAKGNGLGRVCNICSASILKPCDCENNSWILPATNKNNHPTVKPTALMQYLIKLITPVGGTVLDPFNGSGSTGKAAMLCKEYNYIGIDLSAEYIKISKARIEDALLQTTEHTIAANTHTEAIDTTEANNFS